MPDIDLPTPGQPPNWAAQLNVAISTLSDAIDAILAGATPSQEWAYAQAVPITKFLTDSEIADGALKLDRSADMSWLGQRAYNNIDRSKGPVQFLWPPGDIQINTAITMATTRYNVGMLGSGSNRTRFWLGPDTFALLSGYGDNADTAKRFRNLLIGGFTIEAGDQVATPTSSKKGLNIGHIFDSFFFDIQMNNTWATSFGLDFLVRCGFKHVGGKNAGRGVNLDSVTGFGSTFGIGVGAYVDESIFMEDFWSDGSHRMGMNFEFLSSYGLYHKTKVSLNNFRLTGDAVGIGDLGTDGINATNGLIEKFTASGIHIGKGGQALVGGSNGHIDKSVTIRDGAIGPDSRPDQDVYGAHGVTMSGDGGGGYSIEAKIQDNQGKAIFVYPGFRLTPGGIRIKPDVAIRNGGGLYWRNGGQTEQGVVIGGHWEDNYGVAVDLQSAMFGVQVDAVFKNRSGSQVTPVNFDLASPVTDPIISGVSFDATTAVITGTTNVVNPHFSLLDLHTPSVDPSFLYFSTLTSDPTVTELGAGWYTATGLNPVFTQTHVWERGRNGAEPRDGGAGNSGASARLRSTDTAGTALPGNLIFTATIDPPSTDAGRRGIIFSFGPTDFMLFENFNTFYQWARYNGTTRTVIHTFGSNVYTERHEIGARFTAAGNSFTVTMDGVDVWTQATSTVPKTNVVGIYGQAQLDGWALNSKIVALV